jgi:hypothetical protein
MERQNLVYIDPDTLFSQIEITNYLVQNQYQDCEGKTRYIDRWAKQTIPKRFELVREFVTAVEHGAEFDEHSITSIWRCLGTIATITEGKECPDKEEADMVKFYYEKLRLYCD